MDKYLEQIALKYISLILNSVGFDKANKSTCEVLEEIYCEYLEKLGRELKKCSEHHGTTEVSIEDLVYYFEDAGIKCKDLEIMLQNGIELRNKKNKSKLLLQITNNRENLRLMLSQLENNGHLINYDEILEKPILIKQNMDIIEKNSTENEIKKNQKLLRADKESDKAKSKKDSIKKIVEE
ncbi:hypothetical protein H8356DRAFT_398246 [Neocallimastix lanati (nom. inval.)]|uniref:Bromodomain associated domain-containing protein n=1 Tax=Neocallimastix californiae TaxID=1754190 RepID=A0A1Y2CPS4_9FUNG|nr:hypothetical protein H8356DRAFT_398246 [Neocallimastix sp. JGI-2020a]ORY48345.1 hypothetical protein LY90DRAFT_671022 [Neocallimastix californiae]|eukprot:ORY48345.1 hypothetical protein LY90DRAFT_671022 [Neocallimastix californiae]